MFRLDYLSCVLTISSAILLGQKRWQGWLIAAINSIVVCDIALNTSQLGFIPANVFCVGLYAYNVIGWRKQIKACRELHRTQLATSPHADSASPHSVRPRPVIPQLPFETFCCECAVPTCLDGPQPPSRQLLDLHNLLSCAINPQVPR